MKSKKKSFPLSGLLLVNKPSGITSHDLVAKVRRALGTKAVGHTGTLDPMAEGLMVLVLEKATKLSPWLTAEEKAYSGIARLGQTTTTGDSEGEVLKDFGSQNWTLTEVQDAARSIQGLQELPVPKFSAIKVDGEKLYNKARAGESFEPPKRPMNFYKSKAYEVVEGHDVHFYIHCSKGSYIRSWAERLGVLLDTGAHLRSLKRETVGGFKLESALTVDFFEELSDVETQDKVDKLSQTKGFIPFAYALPEAELLFVSRDEEKLFLNGQIPNKLRPRLNPLIRKSIKENHDSVVRVLNKEQSLLGVLSLSSGGKVKISRVFN